MDAYVDFSAINEGAITISPDGKSVEIKLPEPQLKPCLDTDKSLRPSPRSGAWPTASVIWSATTRTEQQQLHQLAEQKISAAANARASCGNGRKKNTSAMLESLLKGLWV